MVGDRSKGNLSGWLEMARYSKIPTDQNGFQRGASAGAACKWSETSGYLKKI